MEEPTLACGRDSERAPLLRLRQRISEPFCSGRSYERQFISDEDSEGYGLPAIGFGPNGQVVLGPYGVPMNRATRKGGMPPTDVYLAIAEGSVFVPRLADGRFDLAVPPDSVETPTGNWTNSIIRISNLTGRARLIKPEFAP